jgi:hypothetical protein
MKLKLLRTSGIIAAVYGAAFFVLGNLRTRAAVWCPVGTEADTSSFEYCFHTFIVPVAIVPFEPYLWVRESFGVGLGPWDYIFAPVSVCLLLWILLLCSQQLLIHLHRFEQRATRTPH